ncbi:hypothetical protein FHS78_003000 [Parvibaculum indicum]|uniref:hypothetical protein n=1 Tax=Parvibaculum indicum TaxID=562969 RepID=UPI001421A36A|nr:hypothetical protein [Parvibaculum indicum]NIJ42695.1 hypothetical protein [Parvibaculum indicum]
MTRSTPDFGSFLRLGCLLALIAGPLRPVAAEAQDPVVNLAGGEGARIVRISPEACESLDLYAAPDTVDGGADYVPGVAVDGSPVAPADIGGGSGYEPRRHYEFDVVVRPLAGGTTPDISRSEMSVAHLRIDSRTGAVEIDGVPLSDGNRHALAEACAELHHTRPKQPPGPPYRAPAD